MLRHRRHYIYLRLSGVKKTLLLTKERRAGSCESIQTRMAAGLRILCLFAAFSLVLGDCYLHNPRGSNNRLNERSANRRNANRMFDSQVSWAGERPLYQLCTLLVRIPIYVVYCLFSKNIYAILSPLVPLPSPARPEQQQGWLQCRWPGHESVWQRRWNLLHGKAINFFKLLFFFLDMEIRRVLDDADLWSK